MIDYIKGEIIELTPTDIVLECHGIGYNILISVQTYSALDGKKEATVYIHHYLREDEELYYGFATKEERKMYLCYIKRYKAGNYGKTYYFMAIER